MAELKSLTGQLLRSGATIQEMNTVRKHLSAIQGGRLAAACRAPVLALVISDVTGDDPTHIASGPCAPDPTTVADAKAVLAKYGIDFRGPFSESPKSVQATNKVIATAYRSLEAAAEVFRRHGIKPLILGDTITGEAREVGVEMAQLARRTPGPAVLISGGECTVTVQGDGGRGGRCCEFLLSLGIESGGLWAIAADTDGIDGTEDNAGAVLTPDFLQRAARVSALHRKCWPGTTATASSVPWATSSSPARRAPTSTTIARSSSPRGSIWVKVFVTNVRYMAHGRLHHLPMEAVLDVTEFKPAEGLMDNTQVKVGYIAHVAVPCRDLEETARWYAEVLGAQPVRILKDRVTFSFGGVLQLVCHLERRTAGRECRAPIRATTA